MPIRTRYLRRAGILLGISPLLLAGAWAMGPVSSAPHADTTDRFPQEAQVVATVGKDKIEVGEVIASDRDKFLQERHAYDIEMRRIQATQDRAYHDLLQDALDRLLDQRALELEAKARGLTKEHVLAEVKVPAVSEQESKAFYEEHKGQIRQTYEASVPQIIQYLAAQHNAEAMRQFHDALRAKHGVVAALPPYRAPVEASGPVRGPSEAPVTIVEFGDFQCPFCKQAEAALSEVLARHPQDVRLIFRNLPLTTLHPMAGNAAEAAVCADRQGKFWAMHDAMYANQNALSVEGLQGTAKGLGMEPDGFRACMGEDVTTARIQADVDAASALGVESTPMFFVNGRPLDGAVPADKFEAIIAEELRNPAKRGS
jgi:protein-disulfide isomerase